MKQYWSLLIVALLIIVPVSANTALNFQQPADFTAQVTCTGSGAGSCSWVESAIGGNNYVSGQANAGAIFYGIASTTATPMTYSAATSVSTTAVAVALYDGSMNNMWYCIGNGYLGPGRFELKMIGSQAYLYKDGVELEHSGILVANPSYIVWGAISLPASAKTFNLDDIVWGSSEPLSDTASDKYVYGMPETSGTGNPYYVLMKDLVNPSANGFYYGNGSGGVGPLISSTSFPSTFSKGNSNNDTIYLQGYTTGNNILTNYTNSAYANTINWDIASFFAANPDYGLYAMHSPSSLKYSDLIVYVGNGAAISWDKDVYAQGESGAVITVVTTGGYWEPATYDYKINIIDVYGTVWGTYPVITQSATTSHTWLSDQDIGVYYAVIIATPKAGGDDIWMNYAICEVNGYLIMHGYVYDGETELVIPDATVNITQGGIVYAPITPTDGNYTVGDLIQGSEISININATGYENYSHAFTPLRVGLLELNFTLVPSAPTYTGIALAGIAFEPPYNRTINSATIYIVNSSGGYSYTATTNSVGYYIQNGMAGPSNWFDVWGSKTGFLNSTIYQKLVVGS